MVKDCRNLAANIAESLQQLYCSSAARFTPEACFFFFFFFCFFFFFFFLLRDLLLLCGITVSSVEHLKYL